MSRQDNTKTITIIGGGLSGLTVFYEQVKAYQSAPQDAPDLHINWIEKSGNFGAGIAYNADDDVFLLNQPAKLMSPLRMTRSISRAGWRRTIPAVTRTVSCRAACIAAIWMSY